MGFVELVITVCAISQSNICQNQHMQLGGTDSLERCAMAAPPYIARWIGEHPKWKAVRWHCEVPGRKAI
jgi:hypothetical protein